MSETKRFELSSEQLKFRDILNKEFLEMEIFAISDIDPNRNNTHFTLESMQMALDGCKNKPIVGFFENNDFTDHAGKIEYDNELKKKFWNTEKGERVLGVIRESDPIEIVEKDGLNWIKVRCALFVSYCYRQIKRLLKDKSKKVSVEITVTKSQIRDDGVEEILEFVLNGITILGSKNGKTIIEAIPDAHATVLEQFDEEELEEQKKMLSFAYQKMEENIESKSVHKKKILSISEIQGAIWRALEEKPAMNDATGVICAQYWIEEIYPTHLIVRDSNSGERFKVLYEITDDGKAIIFWDSLKSLKELDEFIDDVESHYAVSEDKIASGPKITVDKSAKSISEKAWGSIDKGSLKRRVIEAKNFKTIADDIFLKLEDGWENGESSKMKYPVMEINNNVAVYNRGALASAKAYAEKNKESDVMEKVEAIYKDLKLNENDNSVEAKETFEETEKTENVVVESEVVEENTLNMASVEPANENSVVSSENVNVITESFEAKECSEKKEGCDCPCEKDKDDDASEEKDEKDEKCDCHDEEFEATKEALAASLKKCEELEAKCAQYEADLEKYADYDSIKDRMEKAEKTVWEHFCDKMKNLAISKMSCEDIANEDKEKIIMEASSGNYADEEALDKDIAYAVYKNRAGKSHTRWEHFEINLESKDSDAKSQPMTRQERLAQAAKIKK